MAEFAIGEALATAETVTIELYKLLERPTVLHDDVERTHKFLEMIHACLIESADSIDEGSDLMRSCIGLAYGIENVLDEFLLHLLSDDVQTNKPFYRTDDVQTNRSSSHDSDGEVSDDDLQRSSPSSDDEVSSDDIETNASFQNNPDDKVSKFIGDWEAGHKLSTNINNLIDANNVSTMNLLNRLRKDISEGTSRSRLGNSFTFPYSNLACGDEVVGFEEHKEKLLMQLAEEDSNLSTVLVVGPGGSGKSTLVKNVFESDQVQGLFDFKRWVPVPRGPFQLNQLLLEYMLSDCEKTTSASEEKIDPKEKLRHFMQGRKYLIVLDDVWRKEDLQSIIKVLPNDLQGSRIIITSRNSDVASSPSHKHIHDLSSGLSWEKAKLLLFMEAFYESEGSVPLKLLELCSDNILRWSGCLPYAIIAEVRTLVALMEPQTAEKWMEFPDYVRSAFRPGYSFSIISSILQPSYTDLPNHLKTCFLYLSAFPDDYSIDPEKLIHLWVAEGFVEPKRGITEEQVAQEYLNELIARSLVLATEREINGQVRSCRVVNHVRDFLLSKPENFITVMAPNNSTDGTPGEHIRRLSIHQADQSFNSLLARDDLKHIRTLLVFTKYECFNGLDKLVKANKFLRVLDLSEVKCGFRDVHLNYFLKYVDDSILLKYLSLQGLQVEKVPEFIRKLQFLETLNLQSTQVTELPKEICQLSSLRHLLVPKSSRIGVKFTVPNIGIFSSIQSLSLIDVENDAETIMSLGELQQLRKLELVDLEKKDGKELCIGLEKMKRLSTLHVRAKGFEFLDLDHITSPPLYLQHLSLNGLLQGLPKWISKLTSLQSVELQWSYLETNPTELLENLPNLIRLDLVGYYTGQELVFRAHTFKKLMKLSIAHFGELNRMEFENEALPMLRELNMSWCRNLKSLPKGIGSLKLLNKLVLDDMPNKLVAMLQKGREHRQVVRHIPFILRTRYGRLIEDLSENGSSTSNIQEGRSGGRGGKVEDSDEISTLHDVFEISQGHDGISDEEDHDGNARWWYGKGGKIFAGKEDKTFQEDLLPTIKSRTFFLW